MTYRLRNSAAPDHIMEDVKRALHEWDWLVPPWVYTIYVLFDTDDTGVVRTIIREEYRSMYLSVCLGWSKLAADEQSQFIAHELIHIHNYHMIEAFNDLMDATIPDRTSPLRTWAAEIARKAIERGTNDLERILIEKFGKEPIRREISPDQISAP